MPNPPLPRSGHVGARWWAFWVNQVAASPYVSHRTRKRIYRRLGLEISPAAYDIGFGCYFHSSEVSIGARTFINDFCYFENIAPVVIGAGVMIGMQTAILTSTHELGGPESRGGQWGVKPVTIDDGCWIGARALVLPGVRIGRGAVVAAGAVVTSDCEPNRLYGGVPARVVRDLDE
jgi:maltose O-acetyltransferase